MPRFSDLKSHVGQRLRKLRRQRDLTLEQLAERAHLNAKYVQAIETGRQAPTVDTIEKLARGLGIAPHELFLVDDRSPKAMRSRARDLLTTAPDGDVERIVRILEAILH